MLHGAGVNGCAVCERRGGAAGVADLGHLSLSLVNNEMG